MFAQMSSPSLHFFSALMSSQGISRRFGEIRVFGSIGFGPSCLTFSM